MTNRAPSAAHPSVREPAPLAWMAPLWIGAAVLFAVPGVFDMGIVKTAGLALLAAALVVPVLALRARDEIALWFHSPGARLLVLASTIALLSSTATLLHGAVIDRLLLVVLVHVSAVVGVLAAERRPHALVDGLSLGAVLFAAWCWLQQGRIDTVFNAGGGGFEIVGLAGNSTRAGALLALGLCVLVARALGEEPQGAHVLAVPDPRGARRARAAWLAHHVPIVLVSSALMLTRARGARIAAVAGLVALAVLLFMRRADRRRMAVEASMPTDGARAAEPFAGHVAPNAHHAQGLRGPPVAAHAPESSSDARSVVPVLLALVLGIALAALVGGRDTLFARKLGPDAPVLAGGDLTIDVRVALWSATLDMIADRPFTGYGLGRFRAEFPPYRDPLEAALPGRLGARTSAHHPHNEYLLGGAEGGVVSALALVVLVLWTIWRALRLALLDIGAPSRVAAVVLVAGAVLALGQDAWTDPTTAVPFFAALGFLWRPRSDESRAWAAPAGPFIGVLAILLGLGAALLALPRLDGHLAWRHFVEDTLARDGEIDAAAFDRLLDVAATCPNDVDIQSFVASVGQQYAALVMRIDPKESARAIQAVERARERVAQLAPYQD